MANRGLAVGYLLTGIAGWVDAIGFIALQGAFVSFMSGNTTQLGIELAQRQWSGAWPLAALVALFLAGGFLGAVLTGRAGRWALPAVLAVDALVLALAMTVSRGADLLTAGAMLLALAMGLQNAASGTVGTVKTGTTYVTGTLVSAGQELGRIVLGTGSRTAFAEQMAAWFALLLGVVLGAVAHAGVGAYSLVAPALAALGLAAWSAIGIARAGRSSAAP